MSDQVAQKQVLITGVTGYIGSALAQAALARGWRVRGLARGKIKQTSALAGGVDFRQGAVEDARAVKEAMAGCAVVVHLAGVAHGRDRAPGGAGDLRSAATVGTENVVSCARAQEARVIFGSSISVHGRSHEGAADEHSPIAPENDYGRFKVQAEQRVRALAPDALILRFSALYGPHDPGNIPSLFAVARRGLRVVFGDGENRKSIVYRDNVIDRLVLLLERPDLHGVFIVSDPDVPSQKELMTEVCRALGKGGPICLPLAPLVAAGRVADGAGRIFLFGKNLRIAEKIDKMVSNTWFSGAALDRALGYKPGVSFSEGIARTAAWFTAGR